MLRWIFKTALITLTIMICTQGIVVFGKDFTIVEYYNQYVQQFQNNGQLVVPSEIIQRGGTWIYKTPKTYWSKINIAVDIKNGYLDAAYDDAPPGAQGRSVKIACAVFVKADKSTFFAINITKTQMLPEPDLKIYSFNNGAFTDVTKAVLPKVDYRLFLDEKYARAKLNRFKENDSTAERIIDYAVPRFGTTIKASIILDYIDDLFVRDGRREEFRDLNAEKEREKALDEIRENIKYKNIELTWNQKAGKFEIGKKTR